MKKKKLEAKLAKAKDKLAKVRSKVAKLESKIEKSAKPMAADPRPDVNATPEAVAVKSSTRKPAASKPAPAPKPVAAAPVQNLVPDTSDISVDSKAKSAT